jgi:hypothetical protein
VDDLNLIWSESSQSDWWDEFRGYWWTLERVYAVALDRGELDALPVDVVADIEESITGLEVLLS